MRPRPRVPRAFSCANGCGARRPHCGATNANLKVHLGLLVPSTPAPGCAVFTVGGEARPWVAGKAVVFDDSFVHEVRNRCDAERVVLQVPEPPATAAAAAAACAQRNAHRNARGLRCSSPPFPSPVSPSSLRMPCARGGRLFSITRSAGPV